MTNDEINRVYDRLEKKDMPREQFQKEMKILLDPNLMIRDARAMAESKGILKPK